MVTREDVEKAKADYDDEYDVWLAADTAAAEAVYNADSAAKAASAASGKYWELKVAYKTVIREKLDKVEAAAYKATYETALEARVAACAALDSASARAAWIAACAVYEADSADTVWVAAYDKYIKLKEEFEKA